MVEPMAYNGVPYREKDTEKYTKSLSEKTDIAAREIEPH